MGFYGSIYNLGTLVVSLLLALIAFFILWRFGLYIWRRLRSGVEQRETLQPSGDPTRYALASLYLEGPWFRRKVLDLDSANAVARGPEPGLDYETVVRAARQIERVEFVRSLIATILFVICAPNIVSLFNPSVFWMFYGYNTTEAFITIMDLLTLSLVLLSAYVLWENTFLKAREFRRKNYDADEIRERFAASEKSPVYAYPENGNVLCFGSTYPFYGFGWSSPGWQIATTLKAAEDFKAPTELTNSKVHTAIAASVKEAGIGSVKAADILFLNGTEVASVATNPTLQKAFLNDPYNAPNTTIAQQGIEYFRDNVDTRLRVYARFRMRQWGGEIITNAFVRAVIEGKSLTVECIHTLVTPVDRRYRRIDELRAKGFGAFLAWLPSLVLRIPLYWLGSVRSVIARVAAFIDEKFGFEKRRIKREIDTNPAYNYGVQETLREMISARGTHFYFQRADVRRSRDMLNRAVADGVISALKEAGYDITEFERQRNVAFIDNSVNVQAGGDLSIAGAVGANASVSQLAAAANISNNKG